MIQKASDFGYGFTMGFINVDIKTMDKCDVTFQDLKDKVGLISENVVIMKNNTNETIKEDAFREILHILQKLPEDFSSCNDVKTILEKVS